MKKIILILVVSTCTLSTLDALTAILESCVKLKCSMPTSAKPPITVAIRNIARSDFTFIT